MTSEEGVEQKRKRVDSNALRVQARFPSKGIVISDAHDSCWLPETLRLLMDHF